MGNGDSKNNQNEKTEETKKKEKTNQNIDNLDEKNSNLNLSISHLSNESMLSKKRINPDKDDISDIKEFSFKESYNSNNNSKYWNQMTSSQIFSEKGRLKNEIEKKNKQINELEKFEQIKNEINERIKTSIFEKIDEKKNIDDDKIRNIIKEEIEKYMKEKEKTIIPLFRSLNPQAQKSIIKKSQNLENLYFSKYAKNNGVHNEIKCLRCFTEPIIGNRYKCLVCRNYNLCEKCYKSNLLSLDHNHQFIKFNKKNELNIINENSKKENIDIKEDKQDIIYENKSNIIFEESKDKITDNIIDKSFSVEYEPDIIIEENQDKKGQNIINKRNNETNKPNIIIEENNTIIRKKTNKEYNEKNKPNIIIEENQTKITNNITNKEYNEKNNPNIIIEENQDKKGENIINKRYNEKNNQNIIIEKNQTKTRKNMTDNGYNEENKENKKNNDKKFGIKETKLIKTPMKGKNINNNYSKNNYSYKCLNKDFNLKILKGTKEANFILELENDGLLPWPKNKTFLMTDYSKSQIKVGQIVIDSLNPGSKCSINVLFKNIDKFLTGIYQTFLDFNVNGKKYGENISIIIEISDKNKLKFNSVIIAFRDEFGIDKSQISDIKLQDELEKYKNFENVYKSIIDKK